jgi:hypothetical protein
MQVDSALRDFGNLAERESLPRLLGRTNAEPVPEPKHLLMSNYDVVRATQRMR